MFLFLAGVNHSLNYLYTLLMLAVLLLMFNANQGLKQRMN
jgi:hypothetical protein